MVNMNYCKDIVYIGCDDGTLDLFERQYPLEHGVSYNSYVILDEKVAVMDTADGRVTEKWFENLDKALGGRTPDYLIVSHMEPDHSKNIGVFLEKYPSAKIVGNDKTFKLFAEYFTTDVSDRKVVVKEKQELPLGTHTLRFYFAPMVHWPEVMVSYELSEKILFSADAFGKFGILSCEEDWTDEARRYYCNIVGKYGSSVQGLLKKVGGLDIRAIYPLHGPILTDNLGYYIGMYDKWSRYEPEERGIVIAYASIHGNTEEAAVHLRDRLEERGEKTELINLARCDIAQAVADVFRYDRLVVAACTYDAGLFPCAQDFLLHLKAKGIQKRDVVLIENGSWAPQAGKLMAEILAGMKSMEIRQTLTLKGAFKEENRKQFDLLAQEI